MTDTTDENARLKAQVAVLSKRFVDSCAEVLALEAKIKRVLKLTDIWEGYRVAITPADQMTYSEAYQECISDVKYELDDCPDCDHNNTAWCKPCVGHKDCYTNNGVCFDCGRTVK